uniref:Uncharacterized protein n=1 Tax=Romanomermis culicivorax TaxID=13658 RepID=A0A915IX25_ROMCU
MKFASFFFVESQASSSSSANEKTGIAKQVDMYHNELECILKDNTLTSEEQYKIGAEEDIEDDSFFNKGNSTEKKIWQK